jgi:hypothetical protein
MKRKETGKPLRSGAPRARTGGDAADPYQKARRPRPAAGGDAPAFARRPRAAAGGDAPPFARRPRPAAGGDAPAFAREQRPPRREPAEAGFAGRDRGAREGGFTVTLDPDVARVFRGDASVNKALRLVMQLMQVVQGPPRSFGPRAGGPAGERPRRGYQGSAEARGFTRKPRFEDDEQ